MDAERALDLDRGLPVTPQDVEALRQARAGTPSWLLLDWRELLQAIPPAARRTRPLATDDWRPFHLP